MNKSINFIFVSLLVLPGLPAAAEPPATLADILRAAQEHNPEIRAAFERAQVLIEEAGAASVWPNPKVTFIDEKDPVGEEGIEPMTRKHYGVAQDVPFPGKLSSEARMKRHEGLIAEAAYRDVVLKVAGETSVAVYKLASLDRIIDLMKRNESSLQETWTTARSRLAANRGTASEVFLAQIELRRMQNMLFEKTQERRGVEIELNTLLNEPVEKTWPGIEEKPLLRDVPMELPALLALAQANNPRVQSAHHEVNHSRSMRARSRLEYAPDFGFMYEYQTAGDGARGVGPAGRQLGISMSVPLWLMRPYKMSASADAHVNEAQAESDSMETMVRKMVAMENVEVQTHLTMTRRIENDILPVAQAALNTAREQYAAGKGDFMRLLEANRAWISAHMDHEQELYRYAEHWTQLERWVGRALYEK